MLGGVIDATLRQLERLEVRPRRCSRDARVRRARLACAACADACPRSSISLDPLEIDEDRCNGCGLCAAACPTAAISASATARRDSVAALHTVAAGEAFTLSCGRAEAQSSAARRLGCLGELEWESMLVPLLLGASEVRLVGGRCQDCELGGVANAILRRRETAERVAVGVGLGPIEHVERPQRQEAVQQPVSSGPGRTLTRRGLFSLARRRGSGAVGAVTSTIVDRLMPPGASGATEDSHAGLRTPFMRAVVASLIARRDLQTLPLEGVAGAGRPRIDTERCDPCTVCSVACPTGALRLERADGERTLWLSAEACIGCGACVSACPDQAARVDRTVELAEWGIGPTVIASARDADTCPHCGDRREACRHRIHTTATVSETVSRSVGVVGFSGSGKTTLICRLIGHLAGVRVTVLKRTHHERPGLGGGKDTDKYLDAGAIASILVTPVAVHRFSAAGHVECPLRPIADVVREAELGADLVLIESSMHGGEWPRLLVHASGRPVPAPRPPHLEGVVTDEVGPVVDGVPHMHREDLDAVARAVIGLASWAVAPRAAAGA